MSDLNNEIVNNSGSEKENNSEKKENLVEIWTDTVSISNLLLSLVISTICTLGGYMIAPGAAPQPLIFGLIGSVIGFVINTLLFKPKRELIFGGDDE